MRNRVAWRLANLSVSGERGGGGGAAHVYAQYDNDGVSRGRSDPRRDLAGDAFRRGARAVPRRSRRPGATGVPATTGRNSIAGRPVREGE